MGIVRQLQHWLGGSGPRIRVSDFVPSDHYLRLFADTFSWAEMVEAVERSMGRRFPKESAAGRFPISTRVLLALELLKAELFRRTDLLSVTNRFRADVCLRYKGRSGRCPPGPLRLAGSAVSVPQSSG